MSAHELQSLSGLACLFLVIWELLKRHWAGAILSAIAGVLLAGNLAPVRSILSAVLVLPIVFEERWNSRANKDMMRACLAAAIIAANAALVIVHRGL